MLGDPGGLMDCQENGPTDWVMSVLPLKAVACKSNFSGPWTVPFEMQSALRVCGWPGTLDIAMLVIGAWT